jgi:hypothetical protein
MSNEVNEPLDFNRVQSTQSNSATPDSIALPPQLPAHIQIPNGEGFQPQLSPNAINNWQDNWQSSQVSQAALESLAGSKTYGAPRVFDLFTLLAITLAFALLFALIGVLAPALEISAMAVTVAIGVFVSLIGLSQMWLFESNNPRVASLISGPFALAVVTWLPISRASGSYDAVVGSICFGLFIGPIAGYLGGAVVAGVFLLADKFRTTTMKTSNAESKDASFDDVQ